MYVRATQLGKNLLFNHVRPLLAHLVNVDASVAAVGKEHVHVQLATAQKITLANLYQRAPFGHAPPRRMQQLTRERVECQVDASAAGGPEQVLLEADASRVKDVISRDAKLFLEECNLPLAADGGEYFGAKHAGQLNCGQANASTAAMN